MRIADDARVRIVFFDLSFMPLVEEIAPRLADRDDVHRADRPREYARSGDNLRTCSATRMSLPARRTISTGLTSMTNDRRACAGWPAGRKSRTARVSTLLPAVAAFVPDELNPPSQDIVLSAIPMFHADGWGLACAAWAAGATLVFPGPWLDGRSLHELIEGEGVTVAAARPLVWQGLLAHVEREGAGLSGLRLAIVTGDCPAPGATASTAA